MMVLLKLYIGTRKEPAAMSEPSQLAGVVFGASCSAARNWRDCLRSFQDGFFKTPIPILLLAASAFLIVWSLQAQLIVGYGYVAGRRAIEFGPIVVLSWFGL